LPVNVVEDDAENAVWEAAFAPRSGEKRWSRGKG
jgi:hypothetical protein